MGYKLKIESPLVNITLEDEHIMDRDGYTKHHVPDVKQTAALIKDMEKVAEKIIHETIRAKLHGCIDMKKWEMPNDPNKIKVTVEP